MGNQSPAKIVRAVNRMTTFVLSQIHLKPSLTVSKPILTSFMPENYKHEDQSNSKPLSHSDINKFMENKSKHRSQELNSATVLPTLSQMYEAQTQVWFQGP